jgi:hypothetical protein
MKYDYFISGRWRNRKQVNEVAKQLREAGKKVYCFTENSYEGHGVKLENHDAADIEAMMVTTEQLKDWQTNPTFRKIFETDMQAQRDAEAFVLVFPAGLSAHMELGAAYGMGKKCYGIGTPEKAETLYLMFEGIFPNVKTLLKELA